MSSVVTINSSILLPRDFTRAFSFSARRPFAAAAAAAAAADDDDDASTAANRPYLTTHTITP